MRYLAWEFSLKLLTSLIQYLKQAAHLAGLDLLIFAPLRSISSASGGSLHHRFGPRELVLCRSEVLILIAATATGVFACGDPLPREDFSAPQNNKLPAVRPFLV